MKVASIFKYTSTKEKLIFYGIVLTAAYWVIGNSINVYKYTFVSVVYELLWVGMALALFLFPVLIFILWVQRKFKLWSLSFLSLLISAGLLVLMFSIK